MTRKEKRHKAVEDKAVSAATVPMVILGSHPLLTGVLILILCLSLFAGWHKLKPYTNVLLCDMTGMGYLPNGEYAGEMNGSPVAFEIDRSEDNIHGNAYEVSVSTSGGEQATYYLFFEKGSLCLSATPPSRIPHRGDVVERNKDGTYSIRAPRQSEPWLTFSPK